MKLITLENGLRVFFNPNDSLRSAIAGVWVASGSRYENEKNNGISHFTEHIVFKGSNTRSGFEIAEGMDEIGAYVNAYTTKEYTFYYTKALDYQIEKAADILFDMITNPRLDENDIETEKGVILEEISMCEDDPSDVCYEINEKSIFSQSGLAFEILGSRESVQNLKKEDFLSYLSQIYLPERTVIGIGGKYDEEAMLKKVKEYFGNLENKNNPLTYSDIPFNKAYTLKNMPTEQTHIMICMPGVPIEHEDLYALQICMFILGTGTSSMLNQRIREQLGLVYSVEAWLGRYLGAGYIAVNMSLSPESEETAIKEAIKIVGNFSSCVTEKQVAIAKEKLISSLIMAREQPQSKHSSIGHNLLMLNHFREDDEIIRDIKAIEYKDVVAAAEKYFLLDELSFTAVGKVKKEEEYKKIINNAIKNGEEK